MISWRSAHVSTRFGRDSVRWSACPGWPIPPWCRSPSCRTGTAWNWAESPRISIYPELPVYFSSKTLE